MTETEALAKVQEIRECADDDEAAHAEEDNLRQAVLETIFNSALTHPDIRRLAQIALSTCDIKFSRWCA